MRDNSDNLIQSFVVGAVVGTVGALLLAPCRGKDLRKIDVQDVKLEAQERTVNLLHILRDRLEGLIKRAEDFTNQGVGALLEDEIL